MSNSSSVHVFPVKSKTDKRTFLDYPWRQYQGDENWMPPLRSHQKELLNYKRHPFYETADIQTFLARKDGEICGRIAAIIDHAHNRYNDDNRGMFGFFESVNDLRVSDALFDAAKDWFTKQGIYDMRGPLNPSMNYECGLLVEGFDSPPTFMMTYNPPYYEDMILGYGFDKAQDLYAYYGHIDMLDTLDEKLQRIADEAIRRFDWKFRPLDRNHFVQDVETFLDVYNRSLPGQWGFVPLSKSELKHMSGGLKHLIIPDLTIFAEDESGPAGVVFGLLDYNPLIREINGRLFPFGFLKLLFKKRRVIRARLISTNVLPKYQLWGLGLVLLAKLVPTAVAWGIREAEFSWVLESNQLSRGSLERGGAKRIKTYRIFDYHWQ